MLGHDEQEDGPRERAPCEDSGAVFALVLVRESVGCGARVCCEFKRACEYRQTGHLDEVEPKNMQ